MLAVLVILFSCCFFIFSTWKAMYRKQNLPPGPTPLPLIGNLLHIDRGALANSFMKFWKQYGSVYTLYFGSKPVVIICGYKAVREALVDQNENFCGRGALPAMDAFFKGYGFAFANGERWRVLRTFVFRTLRDFGFGNRNIEWKIQEEAQFVVELLKESQGQPLNPSRHFMEAFANILCSMMFGNRFEYSDERLSRLLAIADVVFSTVSSPWCQIQSILPTLMSYIPGPHHNAVSVSEEFVEIVAKMVKSSQETMDPSKPRHFVDCYLIQMEKEKDDPNSEFTMRNLLLTMHNLFHGSTDTVSATIIHALLILLKYPEVQDKLHEEIDRVIGRARMPNIDDKLNMPFTQAVIHEVQRFSDIVPLNMPHMVTKDTEFKGYFIPKGTNVYLPLYTVHYDPTQFEKPNKFNPYRFLDENGQFKRNDACMPFSTGKRICPGENMARMELFIFLTTILQKFTLTSTKEFTEADIAPKLTGFFNPPTLYELSFIPR